MIRVLRDMFLGVLYSVTITVLAGILIFVVFPLKDWTELLYRHSHEVPFLAAFFLIPVIAGALVGFITGIAAKARTNVLEKALDELIREQKLTAGLEKFSDMLPLENRLKQLEDIFRTQSEQSQRLATKRSEEREKSLQDVVIQERNRLARELHDSVSQQLFAASMMMSAFNESAHPVDETARKQLDMIEHMIQQSQQEMRALLLHLRPVPLKGKSLQAGARELLSELQQKLVLEIDWKIEDFPVEKGIEDQLFRILQESVSNTLRHADARHLHVLLIKRDDLVIMRITDDGEGFDVDEAKTSSYGLSNMQERAFEAGGTFKIVSLIGEGTILEVKVPLFGREMEEADDHDTDSG